MTSRGSGFIGPVEILLLMIVMIAVLALIVLGIALLVRGRAGNRESGRSGPQRGSPPTASRERAAALEVLEQRYARGEIDREEFLQRKADLQP
jgi:putative membrane protein